MTGADRFNYKHSEETKKKIGLKSSMKKHTMETKEKIGRHSRGKTYEQLYGKEKADEIKEKFGCATNAIGPIISIKQFTGSYLEVITK